MKPLLVQKLIFGVFCVVVIAGKIYPADTHLNEGLPMMVDNNTELRDIQLGDMTVSYVYDIKNMNIDQALGQRDFVKDLIVKNACKDKDIKELFHKDLKVKFLYCLKGQEILKINMNKHFCQQLGKSNLKTTNI